MAKFSAFGYLRQINLDLSIQESQS